MIGQKVLQSRIKQLLENNCFPRFSIFVGPKGSGKKTFVSEVVQTLTDGLYVESGIKVDDIRDIIEVIKTNNNLSDSLNRRNWELIGSDLQKLQDLIDLLEKSTKDKKKDDNSISEESSIITEKPINTIIE